MRREPEVCTSPGSRSRSQAEAGARASPGTGDSGHVNTEGSAQWAQRPGHYIPTSASSIQYCVQWTVYLVLSRPAACSTLQGCVQTTNTQDRSADTGMEHQIKRLNGGKGRDHSFIEMKTRHLYFLTTSNVTRANKFKILRFLKNIQFVFEGSIFLVSERSDSFN